MKTYTAISPRTAAYRLGKIGVSELKDDIQSFWNDVYTEAVEAGENVELDIVERRTGKRNDDPMFTVGEAYYWAVQDSDGNIDALTELEFDLLHIEL